VKPPSAPSIAPAAPAAEPAKAASEGPKKETAKITLPPAAKPVPQATVNIKKAAAPAAAPSVSATAAEKPIPASADSGDINIIFGIAAAVVALLSLGVQVWTMVG
jgi:hypothetical protein